MVMEMRRFEYPCLYLLILLLFFFGNAVSSSVVMSLKIWWNTLIPGMLVPMILIRFLYLRQGFDALGSSFFNRIFHMKNNGIAYVVCPMLLDFQQDLCLLTKLMKNIISMQKECAGYCSVVVFQHQALLS